jgi:UDP-glucose 4-epimerase
MVVPRFVDRALRDDLIEIYGDGLQTRCFCHVSDTIKALRDLMADIDRTSGQIYNVGAPNQISVIGLAERIKLMTGSSSDTVHVPFAEVYGSGIDDMLHRVPCIDKIRDAIGWHPMHTLEEILHDVIEHATAPAAVGVPAGIAA